jgi:hypothetical protein
LAVPDDASPLWRCPACGKRVLGQRPYVAAQEAEDAEFGPDAPIPLRPVRFHQGHFRPRIRSHVYLLEDGPGEAPAPGAVVDTIRAAYAALGEGEVEPLIALMDRDLRWRGRRSGLQFWRPAPS